MKEFLPLNHIPHISVLNQIFWQTLIFSRLDSTFCESQQTRVSVFALLRLTAGVTESPREPSWGPWTCQRVRSRARWFRARLLIPAWDFCTLCVIDHYKSFYIMEISPGKRSEGFVQGEDSKSCSSCTLTEEARISYVMVSLSVINVYTVEPPWSNVIVDQIDALCKVFLTFTC